MIIHTLTIYPGHGREPILMEGGRLRDAVTLLDCWETDDRGVPTLHRAGLDGSELFVYADGSVALLLTRRTHQL